MMSLRDPTSDQQSTTLIIAQPCTYNRKKALKQDDYVIVDDTIMTIKLSWSKVVIKNLKRIFKKQHWLVLIDRPPLLFFAF